MSRANQCEGLVDGWARRLSNGQPVHAQDAADRDGPFYCAQCHQEVVLRRGPERVGHFAHRSVLPAAPGTAEGALHRACKAEILAALATSHSDGRWAAERTIPGRSEREAPELRPDLSGRVRGHPVAIEVQASALDVAAILQRTRAFAARRIHVLWIVPLPEQLADDAIRPKQHERRFHGMYAGRVYYWWPGLQAQVLPVHFGAATRAVPKSEWYSPGGRRVQAGGYEAPYRTIRVPLCGPKLHILDDFRPSQADDFLWVDRLARWW